MALDDVVILNVDTNTLETPFDDLQSLPNDVVSVLWLVVSSPLYDWLRPRPRFPLSLNVPGTLAHRGLVGSKPRRFFFPYPSQILTAAWSISEGVLPASLACNDNVRGLGFSSSFPSPPFPKLLGKHSWA